MAREGGGPPRIPALPRPRARVHPGMGGGRERRAGCDDAPHRGRVPRPLLGRRDHRDRGPRAAVPPGRGAPRQGGEQRLGRVSVLLGADHARGPRGRARGSGRGARHRGQAEPSRGQPPQERAADARRLHGLPVQPDEPPGVEPPPRDPERVQDDGPPRGELPLVAGPRPRPPPVALPEEGPRQVAARDRSGDVDQLPDQSLHLLAQRPRGGGAGRGVPVHRLVRLHPRRDELDGRLPAPRGDGPREPPAHPHRLDQVHRAVLEPAGVGGAPAGRRPGGGHAGHDRHRDRARRPDRSPRALQPGDQPGRRRGCGSRPTSSTTRSRTPGSTRATTSGTRWPGPRATTSPAGSRWSESSGSARTASSSGRTRRWSGSSIRPSRSGGFASSSPTRSGSSATARSSPAASTRWGSSGGTASSASTSRSPPGSRSPTSGSTTRGRWGATPGSSPSGPSPPAACSTRGARTPASPSSTRSPATSRGTAGCS